MDAYVGFEGYTLPSGFIYKELTIIYTNGEYSHYIFEKPDNIMLSPQDQKTVRYATRHLNSINYGDGDIPYKQLGAILSKLEDCTIYTYSEIATKLIQKLLPTTVVINTQDLGLKLSKQLPDPDCFRIHINYRYCAKAKALSVKDFIEKYEQNSGSVDVQGAEQF